MGEVGTAVAVHPAADIFPDMSDEMFQELVEDIAQNGLLELVVMHDGMILDGRHRWRACERADCVVQTVEWDGECGSPEAFVISRNLRRRHLTSSQRPRDAGGRTAARIREAGG